MTPAEKEQLAELRMKELLEVLPFKPAKLTRGGHEWEPLGGCVAEVTEKVCIAILATIQGKSRLRWLTQSGNYMIDGTPHFLDLVPAPVEKWGNVRADGGVLWYSSLEQATRKRLGNDTHLFTFKRTTIGEEKTYEIVEEE